MPPTPPRARPTAAFTLALLAASCGCAPAPAPAPPSAAATAPAPAGPGWLTDVTESCGVEFTHDAGPTGQFFMPQSMVAGVAVLDADGDGRDDLFFIQSAGEKTGKGNQLYLQTAPGKFTNASAGSGLDIDGVSVGVAVGDVNNDGRPDLVVTALHGGETVPQPRRRQVPGRHRRGRPDEPALGRERVVFRLRPRRQT